MASTEPNPSPTSAPHPPVRGERLLRGFRRLAAGYWGGPTGKMAWLFTLSCALLIFGNIAVQFQINQWSRTFFDALGQKDGSRVFQAMILFAGLAMMSTLIAVAALMARMRLQLGWRHWLTDRMTQRWLTKKRFWRLSIASPEMDSPEFRIAEDARIATSPVVDFAFGLTNAMLTAVVFLSILWSAGGSKSIAGIHVPGFMVFAAIIYCVVMTGSMLTFGRPLITHIGEKNSAEAHLRQELGRVRENAETIAMSRGEADEITTLREVFADVVQKWNGVITQLARMTVLLNTNGVVAPVVPLLLAAPNYLNGTISLGELMQTAAAFVQVQVSLNWVVDNYAGIAEWLASVGRVTNLWRALEGLDANAAHDASHIEIGESTDGTIQLIAVSVAQHDRAVVIDESDVVITKGQHVLLTGASGTGKSTLIRAIAGLWPWGTGQVLLPAGARIAFMPQTPYLPPGSLRNLLEYSATEPAHDDELLTQALERCGLRRLASRLDDTENWVHVLSGGEQQRLSFARLLVQPPDIVLMDGATNALDADTQQDMMNLLREELSACTVITVGQSEDVANFYNVTLTLTRRKDVAQVSMSSETENPNADRGGPAALWRRWAKAFVPPKMSD